MTRYHDVENDVDTSVTSVTSLRTAGGAPVSSPGSSSFKGVGSINRCESERVDCLMFDVFSSLALAKFNSVAVFCFRSEKLSVSM